MLFSKKSKEGYVLKEYFESNISNNKRFIYIDGETKDKTDILETVRNTKTDNIVMCAQCGGVMGDPYTGMTLKKNFFSIEHEGGSSDQWTRIITFKYNIDEGRYYINRDAGEVWNTNSKKKKKLETYSKDQWGVVPFEDYVVE